MASSSFIAEFAKQPPRSKALVFGVIAVVLGFAYFKLSYKPLKEKLENARSDSAQMVSRSSSMDTDIKKFKDLRARQEQLEKTIAGNKKALPSESELPAFFETLNRKVTEAGVEVTKWQRAKEETLGEFIKVPVNVELTGTFYQIKRFMASLVQRDIKLATDAETGSNEERERVVSIEDLALSDPKVKNREIIMTAKFVASTYRQEDKTAGIKPPTPTAPAPASAAAAGSGSGSSGLVTSTPSVMKTATENAVKKGDDRNRAGQGVDSATPAPGSGSAKAGQ
jgi:type IV pilus assembly protein PilO